MISLECPMPTLTDREKAVDKILRDLGLGPELRGLVSREVGSMTGYAAELDSITIRQIEVYLRKTLNQ